MFEGGKTVVSYDQKNGQYMRPRKRLCQKTHFFMPMRPCKRLCEKARLFMPENLSMADLT